MEKTSILLDDKNMHYALIGEVIRIVKDKYNNKFRVSDITSLEEFTIAEKQCLKEIFSPDITGLYAWEHHFFFIGNMWHYDESDQYDYRKTIRHVLLLLNKGKIPIGQIIKTNDYQFVKSIYYDWFNLLDCESQRLYEINFSERDFLLFISQNLKNRLGETSIYNFEFLKAFMEAKEDYHVKKLLEAVMGIESCGN
ncbi:MAG TPA: hypothetical protein PK941_01680 [Paludibacter sp.]|nr:hypothetical protein [Paludibacter sp.]